MYRSFIAREETISIIANGILSNVMRRARHLTASLGVFENQSAAATRKKENKQQYWCNDFAVLIMSAKMLICERKINACLVVIR